MPLWWEPREWHLLHWLQVSITLCWKSKSFLPQWTASMRTATMLLNYGISLTTCTEKWIQQKKFFPCDWVMDMTTANFRGLSIVYGEDVLTKVKSCEFHFKQSVKRKVKTLNTKGEEFRNLALWLFISSTPEAYSHALRLLKTFSSNNAESIRDWTEW